MEEFIISCMFMFIFIIAPAWLVESLARDYDIFEYDRNPYRRHCKRCGQQQDQHTWSWGGENWWEDSGNIINQNCKCHEHSTYKSML